MLGLHLLFVIWLSINILVVYLTILVIFNSFLSLLWISFFQAVFTLCILILCALTLPYNLINFLFFGDCTFYSFLNNFNTGTFIILLSFFSVIGLELFVLVVRIVFYLLASDSAVSLQIPGLLLYYSSIFNGLCIKYLPDLLEIYMFYRSVLFFFEYVCYLTLSHLLSSQFVVTLHYVILFYSYALNFFFYAVVLSLNILACGSLLFTSVSYLYFFLVTSFLIFLVMGLLLVISGGAPRFNIEQLTQYSFNTLVVGFMVLGAIVIVLLLIC